MFLVYSTPKFVSSWAVGLVMSQVPWLFLEENDFRTISGVGYPCYFFDNLLLGLPVDRLGCTCTHEHEWTIMGHIYTTCLVGLRIELRVSCMLA